MWIDKKVVVDAVGNRLVNKLLQAQAVYPFAGQANAVTRMVCSKYNLESPLIVVHPSLCLLLRNISFPQARC